MCGFCHQELGLDDGCYFEPGAVENQQDIVETTDAAGNTSTVYSMNAGDTFTGNISSTGDSDWVRITIDPDQSIEFVVQEGGANPLGSSNYFVSLYDSNGNLIKNEDSFTPTSSTLSYSNTGSGPIDVFVSASDFGSNDTGTYVITATATTIEPLPVYTDEQIADQLTTGFWGGGPYAWDVEPGGSISVDISGLTASGKSLATSAMQVWTAVTGINFVSVNSGAELVFDDNESGAFANFNLTNGSISSANVNISTNWLSTYGTGLDTYSFQTYIHEIGHALGLGHAGNYNGSASYPNDALYANDSWQATVMSYFSQNENTTVDASLAYVITPMIADILAVQDLYGVAGNLRTGDTTYGDNSNAGDFYDNTSGLDTPTTFTIIDDGGTDTIDTSSATQSQTVDLNGGSISSIFGLTGNLSIFTTTVIENFIGGSGQDTVIGNAANNNIQGGDGNDVLKGLDGFDRLYGGDGDDDLDAGAGGSSFQYLYGDGGNDTYRYSKEDGLVFVDTRREAAGDGTADIFIFDDLNLSDFTFDFFEYSNAGIGNSLQMLWDDGTSSGEVRIGLEGQTIETYQFADGSTYTAQELLEMSDTITGTSGNDTLTGTSGNDVMLGLEGIDKLYGGDGDDDLDAGAGGSSLQYLYGEDGNDTYRYSKEDGRVFVDTRREGVDQGTADIFVFDDLNYSDFSFKFMQYSQSGIGSTLRMLWDDGTSSGEIRLGLQGQTIETYQFADGTTMTAQELLDSITTITGTSGNDTLRGTGADDTIQGLDGIDRLFGGDGDDDLDAGAGGSSFQYLSGEDGNDTYRYSKEDGRVFIDTRGEGVDQGTDDIFVFDDLNYDDFSFRFMQYSQSGFDNALRMLWDDGSSSGEVRIGLEGQTIETYQFADGTTMTAQELLDSITTITGTSGNDTLRGTGADDTIQGLDGIDRLFGGDGDDDLDAGAGGSSFQYLSGEDGNDTYRYSKEDGRVFIDTRGEGADQGTDDIFVFDDLNYEDFSFRFMQYSQSGIGNTLRMIWDDGTSSGEIRIGLEGQTIETFQFADGSTYTADDLLIA